MNNPLLQKIHTALLSLCVAGISFCIHFLWDLNAWKARQEEANSRQDITISALTIARTEDQKESQEMGKKIVVLEAVLPEWFKRNFK